MRKSLIKSPYINEDRPHNLKISIVLDLDETLIYYPNNRIIASEEELSKLLKIRPYVKEFIQEMSQYCELILFTSATKKYA